MIHDLIQNRHMLSKVERFFHKPSALACSVAAACTLLFTSPAAQASPPPWTDAAYSYYANNETLPTVLRNFASSVSPALELSPEGPGSADGQIHATSARAADSA